MAGLTLLANSKAIRSRRFCRDLLHFWAGL